MYEINIMGITLRTEILIIICIIIVILFYNLFITTFGSFKNGLIVIENGIYLMYDISIQFMKLLLNNKEGFSIDLDNKYNNKFQLNFSQLNENFENSKINDDSTIVDNTKIEENQNKKLDILSDTKFDTKCCPSSYTNDKGCACITSKQMEMLHKRGGNST